MPLFSVHLWQSQFPCYRDGQTAFARSGVVINAVININIINCLVMVGMVLVCEAAIMAGPVDYDELNLRLHASQTTSG